MGWFSQMVLGEESWQIEIDVSKIDSLCLIFGIGLILFNAKDPTRPEYTIKSRAKIDAPDMFWVNKNLSSIVDQLF